MCGGGKPDLPFGLDQFIFALPFLAILWPVAGLWAFVGYLGAFGGKRRGNGRGISLKLPMKPGSKPEFVEWPIRWLEKRLPVYWYKFLICCMTGLTITIFPAGVLAYFGAWDAGAVILASGLMTSVAYAIGWKILPDFYGRAFGRDMEATEIGEYLAGAFMGVGILIAHKLILWNHPELYQFAFPWKQFF